jgi:hypothetical protein
MTTTALKTTPELNIGDVVHAHGCRLELTVYYYDGRVHGGKDIHTRGFKTKYLGPVNEGFDPIEAHGGYGHHMVNDKWDIQGNERASWAVEVA